MVDFVLFCLFIHFIQAEPGLSCGMQTLSCSIQDLVSQPGIKPGPPALGAWSLTHWTTREVPMVDAITVKSYIEKMARSIPENHNLTIFKSQKAQFLRNQALESDSPGFKSQFYISFFPSQSFQMLRLKQNISPLIALVSPSVK